MWDWSLFWKQLLERDAIRAAEATISAAIVGQLIGVTLGILLGAVGASRRRWPRRVVDAYVRVFRGTPLLLQILAFYIVPSEYGIQLPVFVAGALALGMNEAAYLSEVVRSGLMSVDRGQREAAQVLGMSSAQVLLWVTLPQAARVMIPPMGNAFNAMLKTTSLLGFISYEELLRHANLVLDTVYRPFEIFAVITVYYLAMTTAWGLVQSRLERYFRVGGSAPVARRRPMPRLAEV
ncbi:MAG: ABC transporter permease [Candidatus Rokuibacteriota bacterium]|nr:MAG: ABC transporter permease [Candidatus Rokubacteria bacterium]